jgi:hypothetical protein
MYASSYVYACINVKLSMETYTQHHCYDIWPLFDHIFPLIRILIRLYTVNMPNFGPSASSSRLSSSTGGTVDPDNDPHQQIPKPSLFT